jgi:hypothetical protein
MLNNKFVMGELLNDAVHGDSARGHMIITLVPTKYILPDTATADKGKLTVEKTAKTVVVFW